MSPSFMATFSEGRSAITLTVETDIARHFHRGCGGQAVNMVRDLEIHEFTLRIASVSVRP